MINLNLKYFFIFIATVIATDTWSQMESGELNDHLIKRSNAALTRARHSYERSKIALLRTYVEYMYLFGNNDKLQKEILQLASSKYATRNTQELDSSHASIAGKIFGYWNEIKLIEERSYELQEDLQSVRPLDVEVASFAEVVNRHGAHLLRLAKAL